MNLQVDGVWVSAGLAHPSQIGSQALSRLSVLPDRCSRAGAPGRCLAIGGAGLRPHGVTRVLAGLGSFPAPVAGVLAWQCLSRDHSSAQPLVLSAPATGTIESAPHAGRKGRPEATAGSRGQPLPLPLPRCRGLQAPLLEGCVRHVFGALRGTPAASCPGREGEHPPAAALPYACPPFSFTSNPLPPGPEEVGSLLPHPPQQTFPSIGNPSCPHVEPGWEMGFPENEEHNCLLSSKCCPITNTGRVRPSEEQTAAGPHVGEASRAHSEERGSLQPPRRAAAPEAVPWPDCLAL